MAERLQIELGETATLKAPSGLKGGKWSTTGSHAVLDSDDLESPSVEVVGASIGRVNAFYTTPLDLSREDAVAAKVIGGDHMEKLQAANTHTIEIEVVAKGGKDKPVPKGAAAAVAATGFTSSDQLNGLVPMDETQEEPSEKTPYGMDQFNKPVMPTGSMVSPGQTNIARASEDATATGTETTPAPAEKAATKQAAAKKAATKKTAK